MFKQLAISAGLYRPARVLHRALCRKDRESFQAGHALYVRFVRPGDLCFDVGANIGEKTEILLRLGANVVAIEPQPDLLDEIRARGQRHIVIGAAVAEKKGSAVLHLKNGSTGLASLLPNSPGTTSRTIRVPTVTLDDLIAVFGRPRFIKIDIEGAEPKALRGLSEPIPYLSIEYHCDLERVEIIRECFSLIKGEIEVNAVGPESADYLLPAWLPPDIFLRHFPQNVSKHFYGDLIIRQAHGL